MQECLIFLTAVVKMYSISCWLFIKPGIQERGTECGECRERGGMFTRIPGNFLEDFGECSHFSIPGNAREASGECSRRFRGMFEEIPGNAQEDSGECLRKFRGMLSKIPGYVQEDCGKCSERFRGMFRKIPGSAVIFKLVKATFYLKKHMLSYSRRRDLSLLYPMKQ